MTLRPMGHPARILYTEDDLDTRELVRFVLQKNDCEVVTTACFVQTLTLAKRGVFDIYIIDNWMPGLSGIELCKQLRAIDSKTPILFYSGAALEKDRTMALACGAQGYLTKPATPDELLAIVSRLISEARR